ncbi:MAG TPA: YfhO family protein [Chitinophagaceae bacterium]|nr:YfhO family protein [Chitinophagaceae bacterium]
MNSFLKKATPHLIAAALFLIIAIVYCQPALQGKVMSQHDVIGWRGMAQQSFEFKEKHGHFPLWTNSLFSGMPAYSVAMQATHPVQVGYVYDVLSLGLPTPAQFFFVACLTFYFLCMVLRIRPWLGMLAAIAFAYSTYDPVIVSAGHNTKIMAMAVAPAVIAGALLLFERKYLWGMGIMAIFFGIEIGTQHLQIVYYTFIMLGFLSIGFLIKSYKEGYLKNALLSIGLALVAGLIGFSTYAVSMLPIQEYAKETMRGGRSELTPVDKTNATKGGLDKEYAFRWSYGVGETSTLLVPGAYGGSNGGREHTAPTQLTELLSQYGMPEENALQYVNGYSYWGDQPNTSGPVYIGAVICLLFIFAMVYLKSWHKWWILAAVIFGILLSWGRNFSAFNYFLFDYMPLYNKFRAPSMSLVIPQFLMPLLGVFAIDKLLNAQASREELFKKLKQTAFIGAGIFALLLLFYFSADFKSPGDVKVRENFRYMLLQQQARGQQPTPEIEQQANAFGQSIVSALVSDRKSEFMRDYIRSFVLVALALLLIGAFIRNKLKPLPLMLGLLVLSSFDLLAVGRRYLNNELFVEPDDFEQAFTPTPADQQILADPNKPFRVFDNTDEVNGPWNSARASYFHNSIGGYHPAKLGLYQDLIERQLGNGNMQVFDMLNTKYFLVNNPATRQPVAQINPDAFGPVWLVKHINFVKTPDDEMKALDSIGLRDTAILQEKYRSAIKFEPQYDSTATIKVGEYLNDKITYQSNAHTNQFAVFSEVYYPLGWNAFIDGQKADYVKVNYALRGMAIPAGQHTIEFRFEPSSYKTGNLLTLIGSLLAYALIAGAIITERKKKKPLIEKSK